MKTILFVDDDLENMADHVRKLEEAGFAVTQRRTTDEALHDFIDDRARSYDLILLDMMMPPPDQEELSRHHDEFDNLIDVWDGLRSGGHLLGILRSRHEVPTPPVLILSNLDESELLLESWEQFVIWCARLGRPVPSASTEPDMRRVLRENFQVDVRGKRRTPPWHLPEVVREIIGHAPPSAR
jgi:CheY-like chemotaxis protein